MTELDVCSLEVFEEVGLLLLLGVSSIISVFIVCCFFVHPCVLSMSSLQGDRNVYVYLSVLFNSLHQIIKHQASTQWCF